MKRLKSYQKDPLQSYFNEVKKFELLTEEQEKELGKRIIEGDKEAIKELVNPNLRLVIKIAKGYRGRGICLEDLICEGNIGLIDAAKRYNYEKGFRFSSYASFWIKQKMISAIYNKSKNIRIPINEYAVLRKAHSVYQELKDGQHNPTLKEVSDKMNCPYEKLKNLLDSEKEMLPIESVTDLNMDVKEEEKIIDGCLTKDVNEILKKSLGKKEFDIIKKRFGLDGCEYTLQEIGWTYNVTKERIRQLEEKAIKKLKENSYLKELTFYLDD